MPDGRRNNGGHSTKGKAGRKPKSEEQKLIEALTPIAPAAYKALQTAVKGGEPWAVKMWFEYMHGKPKQQNDITTQGEKIEMPVIKWID